MAGPPPYRRIVIGWEDDERGEDAAALGEMLARTAGDELRRVHIDKGPPGRALRELAERGEADLIVLGSTHRASLGSVAPGSVAEQLLSGSPCRIAIAPRGYARAEAMLRAEQAGEEAADVPADFPLPLVRAEPRVVAVGFNDTPESRAALDEAVTLARAAPAAMWLIGVTEPIPQVPTGTAAPSAGPPQAASAGLAPTRTLEERLMAVAAELPPELRALPVHERGDPVERLVDRAGEGVDLLVLGSRGFGPVMRVLLGSVSARVIRRAPCPVMIVPRPEYERLHD